MKVVYKFTLNLDEEETVIEDISRSAKILSVQAQRDIPCLWVLIDTESFNWEDRTFVIKMTGEHFGDSQLNYVGTFLLDNESFVGHVFEKI